MPKFDLGNDKTGVLPGKYVHFPRMTAPGHREARLFDQAAMAQRHERLGVEDRNWTFDLQPTQLGLL